MEDPAAADRPDRDELRREVLWELAVDAAGIGTFDWDLTTGVLTWDDRLITLFGYTRADFDHSIEAFNGRLHPADLARVTGDIRSALESCGLFRSEYRVVLPDGRERWVDARGRALADATGRAVRLLGAAYETTAQREAIGLVSRALESMTVGYLAMDADRRISYVNAEAERILGRSRQDLVGGVIWELFPATVGTDFEAGYRRAAATGEPVTFDAYYPEPLNAWHEVRAIREGRGVALYFLDVTDRHRAQQQADRATARAELLGRVSEELNGTLDAEEAVNRLARLVVPTLGDWCIASLVDDGPQPVSERTRDVGSWHADPARRDTVARYAGQRLSALSLSTGGDSFPSRALASGRPVGVGRAAAAAVRRFTRPGPARDLLDELAPGAAVALPLAGRTTTIGLLTVYRDPARGPFAPDDLATLEQVAARAGLALDNIRLYEQQRDLAEGLQRSLLTAPVEPDHAQVTVRYVPAAEAAQVGGDWYDAFLQPSGAMVLVIGDVVGHDTDAAAAMGQMRALLRGIAVYSGAGPAALLGGLDRAIRTLDVGTSATAVVCRLEQTPEEVERGITRMLWSAAGHPPPMVLQPDGSVLPLVNLESDLLLGVFPDAGRTESEVVLDRGAGLLLYTDGLVERRGQSLDEGLLRLRRVLEELTGEGLDLETLCDRLLTRMLPDNPEDDVALLAVRLHRQDRPRPPEAGPQRVPPDVPEDPAGN